MQYNIHVTKKFTHVITLKTKDSWQMKLTML